MFNLNHAIAEWRVDMLAAGLTTPVPLDELEAHLREEIEEQIHTGLNEQSAFEAAVSRLGQANSLQPEFIKADAANETLLRKLAGNIHDQFLTDVDGRPFVTFPRFCFLMCLSLGLLPAIMGVMLFIHAVFLPDEHFLGGVPSTGIFFLVLAAPVLLVSYFFARWDAKTKPPAFYPPLTAQMAERKAASAAALNKLNGVFLIAIALADPTFSKTLRIYLVGMGLFIIYMGARSKKRALRPTPPA